MSLLDGGTITATVYVEVEDTDEYGNTVLVPDDTGIDVVGRLQPSTSDDEAERGQVVDTRYRFISRTFPGGPYARVEVGGVEWDVVGTPKRHTGSALISHVTTMLKER